VEVGRRQQNLPKRSQIFTDVSAEEREQASKGTHKTDRYVLSKHAVVFDNIPEVSELINKNCPAALRCNKQSLLVTSVMRRTRAHTTHVTHVRFLRVAGV